MSQVKVALIPAGPLEHYFEMLNMELGDLVVSQPKIFHLFVELILDSLHSHSTDRWYIDYYDQFMDDFYYACEQACVKDGTIEISYLQRRFEQLIYSATFWAVYEQCSRYIYNMIRQLVGRRYVNLAVLDVFNHGLRSRVPIHVTLPDNRGFDGIGTWT